MIEVDTNILFFAHREKMPLQTAAKDRQMAVVAFSDAGALPAGH